MYVIYRIVALHISRCHAISLITESVANNTVCCRNQYVSSNYLFHALLYDLFYHRIYFRFIALFADYIKKID